MKHLIRKPMLSLLLLAVMVFGTAFMAFFRADIAAGWAQIDRLYNDARITVELVPEAGWSNLQMKTHKSIMIEAMPEVEETLSVMECEYILRDGTPLELPDSEMNSGGDDWMLSYQDGYVSIPTATIHGTNNVAWLTEYWDLAVEWLDGWNADSFRVNDGNVPCLVGQMLLDESGLALGDTVSISPSHKIGRVSSQAPIYDLMIVGVYSEDMDRVGQKDILVPEESFLNGPKLLYNGDMMYRCYYRAYALKLNPEFNREYDRIEDQLEKILYDLQGYSFASNAKALENAARPLTQKLHMQELLVMPLCLLFCAAAVVVAVLLGMSMETEVFLRLMWGEKRLAVFAALCGIVCLWLVACVAAACCTSGLTVGTAFLAWAAKYSAATALLCAVGCAIPLMKFCGSNLVKFYQSREGE